MTLCTKMRKNLTYNNIDSLDIIRQRITGCLDGYGIHFESKTGQLTVNDMRLTQYQLSKQTNTNGLKFKDEVKVYFATPDEINIQEINPYLVAVVTEQQRRIWAYATTFWSIPVTTGFGRRVRFLVFDEYNDKLIGIVGLADPIIGLGVRDSFIGWGKDQKVKKLYQNSVKRVSRGVERIATIGKSFAAKIRSATKSLRKVTLTLKKAISSFRLKRLSVNLARIQGKFKALALQSKNRLKEILLIKQRMKRVLSRMKVSIKKVFVKRTFTARYTTTFANPAIRCAAR